METIYTIYAMDTVPPEQPSPEEQEITHTEEVNIYPTLRTTLLVLCVLFAIGLVLFLIYQNGKSIYANGL